MFPPYFGQKEASSTIHFVLRPDADDDTPKVEVGVAATEVKTV
jgi:hypothetical protein